MESKYKRFNCYNAIIKKNVGYTINKEDFGNDEAKVNEYIEKIRKKQRDDNAIYRANLKNKKFNNLLEIENVEKVIDNIEKVIEPMYINKTPFNLPLDNNTGNTLAIFGAGKQGKSTLLMNIYKTYFASNNDYICTLFSVNSHIKLYKSDKKLLKCKGFTKQSEKYLKMEKYINGHTNNKYKFVNLFDDVIDVKYGKLLNEMILTYRNSNMSTIICLQYPYLLSKSNRANLNGVCLFQTNTAESIKDIIDVFLKHYFIKIGITNYNDMYNFYKEATKDHSFIYINNINGSLSFHRLNLG